VDIIFKKMPRRILADRGALTNTYEDIDMASLALTFHETTFNIVECDQQVWITSRELGQALGYARDDAVNKIYERNLDEFSYQMTRNVKMTLQGQQREVRVFSLRGCHLITFFARTPVAKEFRKWVLDILDREVLPKTKNHKTERVVLNDAVNMLVAKTKHLNFSDAYKLIHQRFNVNGIDEISLDQIPEAVEYVHHLIALFSGDNQPNTMNVRAMAMHLVWLSGWWRQFGTAVRGINPHMSSAIHDHFNDGGFVAWTFIEKEKQAELRKRIETYPWHLAAMDRYHLLNSQN
jgi:prophage antirepressor-like protein